MGKLLHSYVVTEEYIIRHLGQTSTLNFAGTKKSEHVWLSRTSLKQQRVSADGGDAPFPVLVGAD